MFCAAGQWCESDHIFSSRVGCLGLSSLVPEVSHSRLPRYTRPQRQRLDKMTRNYIAVLSCGRVGEIDVKICEETTCFVVSFGVAREEWRVRLLQKATLEAS